MVAATPLTQTTLLVQAPLSGAIHELSLTAQDETGLVLAQSNVVSHTTPVADEPRLFLPLLLNP